MIANIAIILHIHTNFFIKRMCLEECINQSATQFFAMNCELCFMHLTILPPLFLALFEFCFGEGALRMPETSAFNFLR